MIPLSSIEIRRENPDRAAGYPPLEVLTGGYVDGNRLYDSDFHDATWEDAIDALEVERDLVIVAHTQSTTWSDFEDAVDSDEDFDPFVTCGLDIGVAGLVLALCAAGCATTTSCRGHVHGPFDYPLVRFFADIGRARIVRDCAIEAGCGFASGGPMEVWGPSVLHAIRLAHLLVYCRPAFERLLPPLLEWSEPDEHVGVNPMQGCLFVER